MSLTIVYRMKASKDAKGNWRADENGGWRFLTVPNGKGRRPEWLAEAEKLAKDGGRGFQFRLADGKWSEPVYRTIEDAEKAAAEYKAGARGLTPEAAEAAEKAGVDIGSPTVKAAIENWLEDVKLARRSAKTLAKYTYILNEFYEWLPRDVRYTAQLNAKLLKRYQAHLQDEVKASLKTVEDKINIICFMLKNAGFTNPSAWVTLPKIEDAPVIPYTKEALSKLFNAMDADEKLAFRFFLDTACREQEVATATWKDIDWKKNEFIVQAKTWTKANGTQGVFTPKNHKTRNVPMTRELVDMLKLRQKSAKSQWVFPNEDNQPEGHFLRKFQAIAKEAELPTDERHYLHRLRKTRATFWHEQGISLRTIQYWLSHESLETTQKYLGIQDTAKLQDEINKPMYHVA